MDKFITRKWFSLQTHQVIRFLVIFYTIGFAGFAVPFTRSLFLVLAKWALLLNFGLILRFHIDRFDKKTIIIFFIVFILGYLIETAGVNTGLIFGNYWYGSGLGLKVFKTPLLIGINWLMLSYCFASITEKIKMSAFLKIIACSTGMLVYDILMEQSASMLDMWYWKNDSIPVQNYVAWFLVAMFFQALLTGSRIKLKNPLAKTVLLCQFIFFLLLAIYNHIVL